MKWLNMNLKSIMKTSDQEDWFMVLAAGRAVKKKNLKKKHPTCEAIFCNLLVIIVVIVGNNSPEK